MDYLSIGIASSSRRIELINLAYYKSIYLGLYDLP
jgi:hypothetical protein